MGVLFPILPSCAQASFRVSWRMLCETLSGIGFVHDKCFSFFHRCKQATLIVSLLVVGAFGINTQKTVEFHYFTGCYKFTVGIRNIDVGRRLFEFGISHL